jgi:hypothetical protein
MLDSAKKMIQVELRGRSVPVLLRREDECGLIFIDCEALPELFLAVKSENEIRSVIDKGLKNAFSENGTRVQVFTNGSISGPTIDAFVYLTDAE